uniref:Uncharacterized protein n=1 Tax=Glomus cerebriforme TaxID=658196 RepID=A0A397SPM9_9GLOM|nr:hypothetical protein C1645_826809 [Glomus cerebriforme]
MRVELNQVPIDWIKDEYSSYDTFVLLKTEFSNLFFDISTISLDYFKHVRIWIDKF